MPIASPEQIQEWQQKEKERKEQRKRETRNRARDAKIAAGEPDLRHYARTQRRERNDRRFIGVDGEGIGDGREHKYVLLGVGHEQIENPLGLQFDQIMEFLWEQYLANPNAVFAGFYLGYDFNQWIKTLPRDRAWFLLSKEGRVKRERTKNKHLGPFPVRYGRWDFDILGMKRFKLRPSNCSKPYCDKTCTHDETRPWMFINDAGPFFQTSLMKAIDPAEWKDNPVVTAEEWEILKEGKANRDHALLDNDMRFYNRLENEVLARLMVRLNEGFTKASIRLRKDQWYGPGQAAQKWMGTTDLPTTDIQAGYIPIQAYHDVWGTYYAGWFELFAHGHIPGVTWEYDINSAYPYVASRLPCLKHGTWHHRDRKGNSRKYVGTIDSGKPESPYAQIDWIRKRRGVSEPVVSALPKLRKGQWRFVYAHVQGSDKHIGTMSHRVQSDGISIIHPSQTTGWFWQHELEAGIRAGTIDTVECLEWWTYTACECEPPMRGLAQLYEERLAVGKNTPQGKGAKLIYNSVYGKNAQTIGEPKYENIIYASLITAGCRTMILDAIATHPGGTKAVVMIATDGVYFRSEHPYLTIGTKMGEWEEGKKVNLTLFKPGVYWDDNARQMIRNRETVKFKARGISAKDFAEKIEEIDQQFNQWNGIMPAIETVEENWGRKGKRPDGSQWPEVTFSTNFSMVTCLQAIQRHKWELAGSLGHDPIEGGCEGCSGSHTVQRAIPGGINWGKDGPVAYGKRGPGYFDGEIYRTTPRKLPLGNEENGGKWEVSVAWSKENATGKTYGPDTLTPDGSEANMIRENLGLGG